MRFCMKSRQASKALRVSPIDSHPPRTAVVGQHSGFTLIEVMVALTIFAFCAVSMHFVLSQSVDSFAKIERKSFASWIAENRLAELRLEENFPAAGNSREDVEFSNREWVVDTVIANTQDPNMRRVEVTVNLRLPNIREPVFVTQLTGFLGKN